MWQAKFTTGYQKVGWTNERNWWTWGTSIRPVSDLSYQDLKSGKTIHTKEILGENVPWAPRSYVGALSILFVFTQRLTVSSIWFVSATLVALIVKRQDNLNMIRMWDFTQKMTADGGPIATHHSCQRHANILFFLWHSGHDMSRQQPRDR